MAFPEPEVGLVVSFSYLWTVIQSVVWMDLAMHAKPAIFAGSDQRVRSR